MEVTWGVNQHMGGWFLTFSPSCWNSTFQINKYMSEKRKMELHNKEEAAFSKELNRTFLRERYHYWAEKASQLKNCRTGRGIPSKHSDTPENERKARGSKSYGQLSERIYSESLGGSEENKEDAEYIRSQPGATGSLCWSESPCRRRDAHRMAPSCQAAECAQREARESMPPLEPSGR